MTWMSVTEFKSITGVTIDDDIIQTALNNAEATIISRTFITKTYTYDEATTKHELIFPVMDINGNSELDAADLAIWEEDTDGSEYVISSSEVSSITNGFRHSNLLFSSSYPTEDRRLYVKYKTGREPIEDMLTPIKTLEKLLAVDYIFTNIPFEDLQDGISSWMINGVSVAFDLDAMQRAMEQNAKLERTLWQRIRKVRINGVAPGKEVHNRMSRRRHGNRGNYGLSFY